MRSYDKKKNIEKANLLAEQRYLKSKGLLKEDDNNKNMTNKVVRSVNEAGDEMAALITRLEENDYINGFILSFRLYNMSEGIGGYETTLWVKNAPISVAKMFCGTKSEYMDAAKLVGAIITSHKTDNKVSAKFQYSAMEKILK